MFKKHDDLEENGDMLRGLYIVLHNEETWFALLSLSLRKYQREGGNTQVYI